MKRALSRFVIPLIFFVSGMTGLVYEVLWARYLAMALGNAAHAHAIVLAVFMGGLAIGHAWLGSRADRTDSPLRWYGGLELAIAVMAAASPWMMTLVTGVYMALAPGVTGSPALVFGVKLVAAMVAILPATILMGGTLPYLGKYFTRSLDDLQPAVARLYFLNSVGASLGALLAGCWLVPRFGLDVATWGTAACNAALGSVAIALARTHPPDATAQTTPGISLGGLTLSPRHRGLIYVVIFGSGFAAMLYEVAWIRLLSMVLGSSAYSFALMLAAFVGGIACGSWVVQHPWCQRRSPVALFALAEVGVAAGVLVTLPLYERLGYGLFVLHGASAHTAGTFWWQQGTALAACLLLMLPPTLCLGMTLPLAARAAAWSFDHVGTTLGRVFGVNTAGNVVGALLSGLVLMPALGLQGLIEVGIFINIVLAALLFWVLDSWRPQVRATAACLPLLGFCLSRALVAPIDVALLASGTFRMREPYTGQSFAWFKQQNRLQTILSHVDDVSASVTVAIQNDNLHLRVNGKTDASIQNDLPTQVLIAHIPLVLHPAPSRVLLVGMGSGITAGSVLSHPVKSLDVVEIAPAVVQAAQLFAPYNHQALQDPRLRLHIDDALSHLRLAGGTYDLIINEPSNPWVRGVGNLFTTEYYQQATRRLAPGGLFVQWVQSYEMDDDTLRLMLRTLTSSFSHVSIWQVNGRDLMLVASPVAHAPDFVSAERRLASPRVRDDLARVPASRLATLLSLQAISAATAQGLAGPGLLNTLERPLLEYQAPIGFYTAARAGLVSARDERVPPLSGQPLMLADYLADRGTPLSPAEFAELYRVHRKNFATHEHAPVTASFLARWNADFPHDPVARQSQLESLKSQGKLDEALVIARLLLKLDPANVGYASEVKQLMLLNGLSRRFRTPSKRSDAAMQ